jgi:carbon-monoxide dehydrogenase medium subunit
VKPPPFAYHAPRTLAEATELLATLENAKLLAGGQSLMPMLNMRFVLPDHVIDLNRVGGLAHVEERDGRIAIGSMVRQRDLELSPRIAATLPMMAEALRHVGHVQTRNRGTIGGSLCHLDPAAELPAIAMAYDAEVTATSPRGARTVPMASFPATYMTPALEPDEIVAAIQFTPWSRGHGYAFEEFARRHGDFAIVAVAALLERRADGTVARASLTVAGVGPAPLRIAAAEQLLVGRKPEPDALERTSALCREIDAVEDAHASRDYRRHLAGVLARRALTRAAARLGPVR